jgi:hypothetical protein
MRLKIKVSYIRPIILLSRKTGLIFAYTQFTEPTRNFHTKVRALLYRPMEKQSEEISMSAISCSEALRAIGQDLEARGIKTFVIRRDADFYVVEAGYQSPPAPTPVSLHYTLDDIERLDHEGRERRDHDAGVEDFLRLSQILRAIGRYVTCKGARLLSISNNALMGTMPVVRIEYETSQGEKVVDDRTGSAIYDMCVTFYKLRGRLSANHFWDAHRLGTRLLLHGE